MSSMQGASDESLLTAYSTRGCEDSFRSLVARYNTMVFSTAARILGNGNDAEDAAQAAFTALALKSRALDASRGLGPWLHRVTVRAALDIMKSARRRKLREEESARQDSLVPCSQSVINIDEAIEQLPMKLKQALVMHYIEGRGLDEIARICGCTPSAISMRLTRARDSLKKRFGVIIGTATLAASGTSVAGTESIMSAIQALDVAQTSSGIRLVELARQALRPSWREVSSASLAGASAAAFIAVLSFGILPTKASDSPSKMAANPALESPTNVRSVRLPPPSEHPLIQMAKENPPFSECRRLTDVLATYASEINAIRDDDGRTALHWALKNNADDYAALMLQRGADPNLADSAGRSPLRYAVDARATWSLLLLILRGADMNQADVAGLTPLGQSVIANDLKNAEILLWAGANPNQAAPASGELAALLADYSLTAMPLASVSSSGLPTFVRNPVHAAARRGDFPMLEKMLTGGPGANVRDEKGRTPLHEAISAGQAEVVFYLLMMGADPNALDNEGRSPLSSTMGWLGGGLDGMRRFLFSRGANPSALRGDGHTETTWSVVRDNEHGLQWLLWMGADPRQRTKNGTPFEVAVNEGNQRIIDLLRRNGVDGTTRLSDDPIWLLHNAAKRGDIATLDEALAAGAPIDQPNEKGDSPLMLAIYKRNVAAALHILKSSANINFKNEKNGTTPLFATVIWDYPEMTEFRQQLLEAGADPNTVSSNGLTPLMRSVWHHPTTPLRQLIEYGADLNARDSNGKTALRRAFDEGKIETAEFLKRQGATE